MEVAARYPAFSLAWALLAEDALAKGSAVEGYAYARTGYHRGLDQFRRMVRLRVLRWRPLWFRRFCVSLCVAMWR